jgi:shikimate dehydrogenase
MKLGLIGFPLSHSFSKKFFQEKFLRHNLPQYSYELFPISSIELLPALIQKECLVGLNVTIPYKESVLNYCTYLSNEVQEIRAANCLKIVEREITAYNTDVIGFEKMLLPLLSLHHRKALILGSGGSSKAVQFVFKKLGIPFSIVSRKNEANFTYQSLSANIVEAHSIIVNTTPLGMYPNVNEFPNLPYHAITPKHLVIDLIYNPNQTMLLAKAAHKGAQIQNGIEMLHLQAEAAWKIWTA